MSNRDPQRITTFTIPPTTGQNSQSLAIPITLVGVLLNAVFWFVIVPAALIAAKERSTLNLIVTALALGFVGFFFVLGDRGVMRSWRMSKLVLYPGFSQANGMVPSTVSLTRLLPTQLRDWGPFANKAYKAVDVQVSFNVGGVTGYVLNAGYTSPVIQPYGTWISGGVTSYINFCVIDLGRAVPTAYVTSNTRWPRYQRAQRLKVAGAAVFAPASDAAEVERVFDGPLIAKLKSLEPELQFWLVDHYLVFGGDEVASGPSYGPATDAPRTTQMLFSNRNVPQLERYLSQLGPLLVSQMADRLPADYKRGDGVLTQRGFSGGRELIAEYAVILVLAVLFILAYSVWTQTPFTWNGPGN